eukprot:Em0020g482a
MFWWLYGSTGTTPRNETPLVMWLQGGPGASSTGFGNFEEIGPLDVNQAYRPFTWVKAANVLFVDNPVGTGYSYVTDNSAYTTNVSQIADDLLTLFQAFLQQQPAFQNVPFYIFSESYGGKMAAAFGLTLFNAIKAGQGQVHIQGCCPWRFMDLSSRLGGYVELLPVEPFTDQLQWDGAARFTHCGD